MAKELESLINTLAKSKKDLIKAQEAARSASVDLLNACIDARDSRFLKLDEEALKHYCGVRSWQSFPDS